MEFTSILLIAIGVLIAVLFATAILFVLYSGLMHNVVVGAGSPPIKKTMIAYKFGKGPYKDTGATFTEVTSIAPSNRSIGIYYDDPYQIAPENLRWIVGSILSEGTGEPDQKIVDAFKKENYKIFHLPEITNAVKASFPHTTVLSIYIAVYKVYPALAEYIDQQKLCAHPFIDVYDEDQIHYMAPLAKQDEFYVPEALQAEEPDADESVEKVSEDMPASVHPDSTLGTDSSNERSLTPHVQPGISVQDSGVTSTTPQDRNVSPISSDTSGLSINSAETSGLSINSAETSGLSINSAETSGLSINSAEISGSITGDSDGNETSSSFEKLELSDDGEEVGPGKVLEKSATTESFDVISDDKCLVDPSDKDPSTDCDDQPKVEAS